MQLLTHIDMALQTSQRQKEHWCMYTLLFNVFVTHRHVLLFLHIAMIAVTKSSSKHYEITHPCVVISCVPSIKTIKRIRVNLTNFFLESRLAFYLTSILLNIRIYLRV